MTRFISVLIAALLLAILGLLTLKLNIPLQYAEAELRQDALEFVLQAQEMKPMTATETAKQYLYFGTDYHGNAHHGLKVKEATLAGDVARISIYEPETPDDSVHETISRIYLKQDEKDRWKPFKHEWAHKGRGRLGWTTKPTL